MSDNERISRRVGLVDDQQEYPFFDGSTWKQKVFGKEGSENTSSGNPDCCKDRWNSQHDCIVHLAGFSYFILTCIITKVTPSEKNGIMW